MKKHFLAAAFAIIMCLTALAGCSLVRGFEKDVYVVFNIDGEYYDSCTVNIFNNGVIAQPEEPKGKRFKGWTVQTEWTVEEIPTLELLENTRIIRYDDVKDLVEKGSECVVLNGVFADIVRHDLKIAWYGKSDTSGIDEAYMEEFKTKLYGHLTSQSYTTESMDIVFQPYDGNVSSSCGAIKKDGDVDIMLGWKSVSGAQWVKGEDYLDEVNLPKLGLNITDRRAHKLYDSELVNLVYDWIQKEYGEPVVDPTPDPDPEPTPDPDPSEKPNLVIGWWDYSSSGLTKEVMDNAVIAITNYLVTEKGYSVDNLTIEINAYSQNKVADVAAAVNSDNNVDIMFGLKAYTGIEIAKKIDDVQMGGSLDRRILLLKRSTSTVASDVYTWFETNEDARKLFAPSV